MADGIYAALSGGMASLEVLDVLSNNLANADAHGYKSDRPVFAEALAQAKGAQGDTIQVATRGTLIDTAQGPLQQTRNPLDVAMNGDGFFTVQTPAGERLTRRGDFRLGEGGTLVTASGHAVLGEKGPVTLPAGEVTIDGSGGIQVAGRQIDRLRISDVPAASLRKEGDGLLTSSAASKGAAAGQVVQGSLERSNVSAVGTMSQLMMASRTFELAVQMMQSYRRMDEKLVADMGKNS